MSFWNVCFVFQWVSVLFSSVVCAILYILLESCRNRPSTFYIRLKGCKSISTWCTHLFTSIANRKEHRCVYTQGPTMDSWSPFPAPPFLKWVSAPIPWIKILRTSFISANGETASDEMPLVGSVCVDGIFIINRLLCVWCVYHTSGWKLLIYIVLAD